MCHSHRCSVQSTPVGPVWRPPPLWFLFLIGEWRHVGSGRRRVRIPARGRHSCGGRMCGVSEKCTPFPIANRFLHGPIPTQPVSMSVQHKTSPRDHNCMYNTKRLHRPARDGHTSNPSYPPAWSGCIFPLTCFGCAVPPAWSGCAVSPAWSECAFPPSLDDSPSPDDSLPTPHDSRPSSVISFPPPHGRHRRGHVLLLPLTRAVD